MLNAVPLSKSSKNVGNSNQHRKIVPSHEDLSSAFCWSAFQPVHTAISTDNWRS